VKLQAIRLCNFQSFGEKPVELTLKQVTYLIGPNGSGKTAALQALCRLFSFDPSLRRVHRHDFHVQQHETEPQAERTLWIEADFVFPELEEGEDSPAVAPFFAHMRLSDPDGVPRVRFRLDASLDLNGYVEETFVYVLETNLDGSPLASATVPKLDRGHIQVHYLPARRDPADHIAFSTNALLGRLLRAVNWDAEREGVKVLTDQISGTLAGNLSIDALSKSLKRTWKSLHKGKYFANPQITFAASDIDALLRHMSVSFSPGHDEPLVDFSRLSDGQKSMLYLSLVLTSQAIGRAVLAKKVKSFHADKLRPPVFTLIAIEEPENSLSPHYLGRIVSALSAVTKKGDAQALIATHAPSMLRRVDPRSIRYLRLSKLRTTRIRRIRLPKVSDEAYKFVREGVQAFPEIYFARLVVLGEGDSEEIVLPRILRAKGVAVDEYAVAVAPLSGRHVNHFWRLLSHLRIPYMTLLDLDVARHGGGWGRIKYVNDQLGQHRPDLQLPSDHGIPKWNSSEHKVRDFSNYLKKLERSDVYFSSPMDLDFSMIMSFPAQYGAKKEEPTSTTMEAVLGKSHHDSSQYSEDERRLFGTYHKRFKLGSKPAAHIEALSKVSDKQLLTGMPASLARLADAAKARLTESPE
jgi:putative ATP-dependent endonuclease of OLD family